MYRVTWRMDFVPIWSRRSAPLFRTDKPENRPHGPEGGRARVRVKVRE